MMTCMDIDIKTLHLCREIEYFDSGLVPAIDPAVLASHARTTGECLLVFDDTTFIVQTADGPRLNGTPRASAVFAIEGRASADPAAAAGKEGESFSEARGTVCFALEKGDYAFFQTRYRGTGAGSEWTRTLLEEFALQLWWEQIACRGPWMLRLVPEDGEIAFQTLRRLA